MTDRDVIDEYLRRAAALDAESYGEIWDEDGRLEMPFHPDSRAREVIGRGAIEARMSHAAGILAELRWIDPSIRSTEVPGQFVVETRSKATRTDGGVYENRYVIIAEVRDGLVSLWREYFAPEAVAKAAESSVITKP